MKRQALYAATLRLLEDLYESRWVIVEAQRPFRDTANDNDLRHQLRRNIFILAENSEPNRFGCAAKVGSRYFRSMKFPTCLIEAV
jgi:hypothetical protein